MNYRELHETIMRLSEEDLRQMLDDELRGERRRTVLVRLHQRYCTKRARREREEIENVCRPNT